MTMPARPERILLVTGQSGAGKITALRAFEDMGWEIIDNLPLPLLDRLLHVPLSAGQAGTARPLAIGLHAHTRGFDSAAVVERVGRTGTEQAIQIEILFVDCADAELARRYSETRRRHPLALDRPVADGITRERELLSPLKARADYIYDTGDMPPNQLAQELRRDFAQGSDNAAPALSILSFGFSRGLPRHADLVFDMRFLRNPHWNPVLRPQTGLDPAVGAYVADDPAYEDAVSRIEELVALLLPRYAVEGKSYITVAFGCTGGRHRSVHVAERVAKRLRGDGFSLTMTHRDLAPAP